MARKSPTAIDIKKIFALSGNVCAFPNCNNKLINDEDGTEDYVGEICHIEAVSKGGPRYNPNMTDEERASANNLILLCPIHHSKIDKRPEKYTVEFLQATKKAHESLYKENPYKIKELLFSKIVLEYQNFMDRIKVYNSDFCNEEHLAYEIDTNASFWDNIIKLEILCNEVYNNSIFLCADYKNLDKEITTFLKSIGYDTEKFEKVPYYENPFSDMHWETCNLAVPNKNMMIEILICQLKIEYLMKLPNRSLEETQFLKEEQDKLEILSKTATHID